MSEHWFRLFPSEWLEDVSAMSASERGVYVTLVFLMCESGGSIKRDDVRLARRCGIQTAWFARAIQSLIGEGKIVQSGDLLTSNKAKEAVAHSETHRATQSARASSGWQKRKEKQSPKNAGAMPGQCRGNAGASDEPRNSLLDVTAQKKETPAGILSSVVCPQTAADIVAHRKALRKPLTDRAAREIANALAKTGEPEAAAAHMIRSGWQGFNADWYANAKRSAPANRRGGAAELWIEMNGAQNEQGKGESGFGDDIVLPLIAHGSR